MLQRPVHGRYRNLGPRTAGATSGPHAERLTAKCSRSLRRRRRRALEESRKMPASAGVPNMAALLGIVLVWSIASTAVGAHESWINRGGYRNSAGEWCCGDNDCESPGQIAVYREGLGHRGQGIRPIRRGHTESGRKDPDLPPARSHTPLCIRTATRLVARRRCGKIRQISARFHKPTVAGRDVESPSRATRGAGGFLREGPAQSRLRNLADAIRGAACSGGAAAQQT